jgi:hypothetical protein
MNEVENIAVAAGQMRTAAETVEKNAETERYLSSQIRRYPWIELLQSARCKGNAINLQYRGGGYKFQGAVEFELTITSVR